MTRTSIISILFFCTNLWAQAPYYPVENFAKLPQYSNPQISPDGRKIAATIIINGKPIIYVKNRDEPAKVYPPLVTADTYFSRYAWANNDRVIVALRGTSKRGNGLYNYRRLVSARFDGSAPVGYKMEPDQNGYFRQYAWMVGQNKQDTRHMLMALDDDKNTFNAPLVHQVDLETGEKKLVEKNTRGIGYWVADHQGRLRIGIRYKDSTRNQAIFYRINESSPWEELQNVKISDNDLLEVFSFMPEDDNILLVTTDQLSDENELTSPGTPEKLYRYNLTTRTIEGEYVDTIYNKIKATAQKAMPGYAINIISHDDNKETYTLSASSDDKPELFFLYDRKLKTMDLIGSAYPQLEGAALAKMQKITYPARDNYKIPALLTTPNEANKNLPFIIFVHGGPESHDEWGFNNYVQYFANRGYGVLQPQFRGSTGFGIAHNEAGRKQWGKLIQDDITDGVKWLVKQGIADPKHICIVGGNFGGYAAAIGLAKTPELYACGISINGVMDLEQLYDDSDHYAAKNAIRDALNERNNLEANSPIKLSNQVKAPLLLIAATKDTVVPFTHSTKMHKKLAEQKKPVEFIELPNGEHWLTSEPDQIKIFNALEGFLSKYLGPQPKN
ncbi:MAG: S9 family peptidase [Marinagarivorans sp.]